MQTYTYYAQKGETLHLIADKFGCEETALCELNARFNGYEGEAVIIPGGCDICNSGRAYKLKRGETVFEVAEKFGLPVTQLVCANPYFNPVKYLAGQIIIIPVRESFSEFYDIKSGENIYSVSRNNQVSIKALLGANPSLSADEFAPGRRVRLR